MGKANKRILSFILVITMVLSLCACGKNDNNSNQASPGDASSTFSYNEVKDIPDTPEASREQKRFDEYTDSLFKELVTENTLILHYTVAHPEKMGISATKVSFGEAYTGEESFAKNRERYSNYLTEVDSFEPELLTTDQQLTLNVLKSSLENEIASYDFPYYYEPFAYTSGFQVNFPIDMAEYIFYDEDDVNDYLKLLELCPEYFDQLLTYEQDKSKKGLFMSRTSADSVIEQCEKFIENPEHNLIIDTFNERIGKVDGISEAEIEEYKKKNHDAVINCVIPAYKKTINTFKMLRTTGKNDKGLAGLPDGKSYYNLLLKSKVGLEMTGDEVAAYLDEQIDSIMEETRQISVDHMEDFLNYYNEYDQFYDDVEPKAAIDGFASMFADKFPDMHTIDFTISPVHDSLVDIVSPAFYMIPPIDEATTNVIHTNMESENAGSLWSTLAHEGIPGHMYMYNYFIRTNPAHVRSILNFTGYSEGWATYTEIMSFDYFDYEKETYGKIEALNTKLNLVISTRIGVGVNYEGWDIEQTEEYLSKLGLDGEVAKQLYDYVVAEPCNYEMYCMGWLQFERLRELAKTSLGNKYDEKNFHKAVLDAGPCQFKYLEEKVNKYIDAVK